MNSINKSTTGACTAKNLNDYSYEVNDVCFPKHIYFNF